ncbi:hypothetical protein GUITHDRAFT_52901, partial [Guillardia theta CCMP2712]
RVEVDHEGTWGTVCGYSDAFSDAGAQVVCRQVGCPTEGVQWKKLGGGSGPIWMDYVDCTGAEQTLQTCPFAGWGDHEC